MAKPTHDLRLVLASERNSWSDFINMTARVVYINDDDERAHPIGAVLNPRPESYGPTACLSHLADLAVSAQRDVDSDRWYAFRIAYERPYSVGLRDLEVMVKGMRAINRRMDKLTARFGHPDNLATFLAHAAEAIGCTSETPFGQYKREGWATGHQYRWGDVDTMRLWLDKM